jgi:hypothetical protein
MMVGKMEESLEYIFHVMKLSATEPILTTTSDTAEQFT